MAKAVILSHLPFSEEWPLELVGTPVFGGVGTPFFPPPVLLCDLGAFGAICSPQIPLLPSQFSLPPTNSREGLPLSDEDLRLNQSITILYLLLLNFQPVACSKIGYLKLFFLKVTKRKRR
jgi:hypothetical protein